MSVNGYGLGRLHSLDARDHAYLLRATEASRPRRSKTWPLFAKWLDQGATGTCVGHAFRHLLTGTPQPRRDPLPSAYLIYDKAIEIDEFPENDRDYARQFGTSVRAGARVLQGMGLISAYGWAYDIDTAIDWLCWHGPLVSGTVWLDSMFDRRKDGSVAVDRTRRPVGGHAYLWAGWNEKRGAVYCVNSWRTWGGFWLAGEDAEWLLLQDGEVCSPTEVAHTKGAQG